MRCFRTTTPVRTLQIAPCSFKRFVISIISFEFVNDATHHTGCSKYHGVIEPTIVNLLSRPISDLDLGWNALFCLFFTLSPNSERFDHVIALLLKVMFDCSQSFKWYFPCQLKNLLIRQSNLIPCFKFEHDHSEADSIQTQV